VAHFSNGNPIIKRSDEADERFFCAGGARNGLAAICHGTGGDDPVLPESIAPDNLLQNHT
jgi:hypothetical protein